MKITRRIYLAGVASLAVGSLAAPAIGQPMSKKFSVILGPDGYWYLLHHIAKGAGFFASEGIDVEEYTVNSGARQMAGVIGGSADTAIINLTGAVQALQNGGSVASIATVFNTFAHVVFLSNKAMQKAGMTTDMSVDEKVKRLRGLRIGITGPSSGSDQLIRTVMRARGMDPDKDVSLQPLGAGEAMIAALERDSVDGFVMSAPIPQIAAAKGLGKIALNTVAGEIPEFNGLTYLGLMSNGNMIEQNKEKLRAAVRAYTRGMKLAKEKPDEARRISRAHFTDLDDATFLETYNLHARGIPVTPILSPEQYDQSLKSINYGAAKPISAPYEKAFYPNFAHQAAHEILGLS